MGALRWGDKPGIPRFYNDIGSIGSCRHPVIRTLARTLWLWVMPALTATKPWPYRHASEIRQTADWRVIIVRIDEGINKYMCPAGFMDPRSATAAVLRTDGIPNHLTAIGLVRCRDRVTIVGR